MTDGFRNILWRSDRKATIRDGLKLEFKEAFNPLFPVTWKLDNDPLLIGTVELTEIQYIFTADDLFYKVFLTGPSEGIKAMKFILTYKFGDYKNKQVVDDATIFQWLDRGTEFTLWEYSTRFNMTIENVWPRSEAHHVNTNVLDF
jgi:hypothetical protein